MTLTERSGRNRPVAQQLDYMMERDRTPHLSAALPDKTVPGQQRPRRCPGISAALSLRARAALMPGYTAQACQARMTHSTCRPMSATRLQSSGLCQLQRMVRPPCIAPRRHQRLRVPLLKGSARSHSDHSAAFAARVALWMKPARGGIPTSRTQESSPASPSARRSAARLPTERRVSGWSSPSTRRRRARDPGTRTRWPAARRPGHCYRAGSRPGTLLRRTVTADNVPVAEDGFAASPGFPSAPRRRKANSGRAVLFGPGCRVEIGQAVCEFGPGPDRELTVYPGQVGFDGLDGHKQFSGGLLI